MCAGAGLPTLTAGVTNDFQIISRHPRAKLHNDISVNENHHAATAFRIAEVRTWFGPIPEVVGAAQAY
jgi:hypothetical protein